MVRSLHGGSRISWIEACGRSRTVAAGEPIIRQGDRGSSVYYIVSGRVLVLLDEMEQRPVAELGAGEVFGEMAALAGGRRSATVIAAVPSQVIELEAAHLREAFARIPYLREQLGRLGVSRAEDNLERLRDAA